jgi:phosphoglycerate kinase
MEMAKEYSELGDYFVDESFPIYHRKHATNAYIKKCMPYAVGIAYQTEIEELTAISKTPQEPLVVISGGAKLETKIPVLEKLAFKADHILIGGLICFTLLEAKGIHIEGAQIDQSLVPYAESLINTYDDKLVFPVDFVYGDEGGSRHPYDIGPKSIELFGSYIKKARSLFWNGPLGFYENGYTHGTKAIAQQILDNQQCYSIIGGGDITSSLSKEMLDKFDFVSAGGGATLDFLAKTS